jgi:hypothetical protein
VSDPEAIAAGGRGPLLVYGVVPAGYRGRLRSPGVRGHTGFETVVHGQIAAVVSFLETATDATPSDLRAYLAVLEEIMSDTTVLPMRFGMAFDGPEEVVAELLAPREPLLTELLGRMDGLVEIRVRATYREAPVLEELLLNHADLRELQRRIQGRPEDATYYERIELGRRVADGMTRLGHRDAEVIESRLGRRSEAVAKGEPPAQRQVTNSSYLVARSKESRFLEAVESLRRDLGERLDLRASEAMPPFSFVDMELGMAATGSGR